MKRRTIWLALGLILTLIVVAAACSSDDEPSDTPVDTPVDTTPAPADPASIIRGGAMYDKWWTANEDATEPTGDQALWATQSSNTRSGADTWRCKECHGWDYQGVDGAYASGSHSTGFPGVLSAGDSNTAAELLAILKGGDNADHDFSSVLSDSALEDLANFINEGLIDNKPLIDYAAKAPIGADLANGESLYVATCAACHGADGTQIDFHGGTGVAGVANDNPWETLHKIRFGQPGTGMPAGYSDWSVQDQVDVLGYAQTLLDADPASVARGGALYDKWWKVADGATEPTADMPLWATQSSNARSGADTWRCKECHGWDYQGAGGAYDSDSSHYTGFPGVLSAGDSNTAAELVAILKGGNNADHDFSGVMNDAALEDLGNFLNEGLIDDKPLIDYDTKEVIGADLANGDSLYDGTCAACHGTDGMMIDIEGAGVGAIANDNPWETLHKIRFGHPGTGMPATHQLGWSVDDQVDVLGHAQTLLGGAGHDD